MITCQCGVEYPYPDLEQVVCRNGVCQVGYQLVPAMWGALMVDVYEDQVLPCPCSCHHEN
mgnify:CR=1 FL=1